MSFKTMFEKAGHFSHRHLPFLLVTSLYLLIVRALFVTLEQLFKIYTFQPLTPFQIEAKDPDLFSLISILFYKLYFASPLQMDLGDTIIATLKETLLGSLYVVIYGGVIFLTWGLSTRVTYRIMKMDFWGGKAPRWIMFITLLAFVMAQVLLFSTYPLYQTLIPQLTHDTLSNTTPYQGVGIRDIRLFHYIVITLPIWPIITLIVFLYRKWNEFPELQDVFYDWTWQKGWFGSLFERQNKVFYPDIFIGIDVNTNEKVIQSGKDRNLNNIIVGSIGTGKTSARIIPELNQDLNYMCELINHIDEETDEERANRINGMIVIEPSNDLCQAIYRLACAHNIPEEAIYYLDPTNEKTVSINPLRGPIEKAVETFTMVLQGLAGKQEEFFKQAQRSHLKHYVYLLKLYKGNEATFDDLMEMYHDPRLVADYFEKVKKTLPESWDSASLETLNKHWKEIYGHAYVDPDRLASMTEAEKSGILRDLKNHWSIVSGILAWFELRGLEIMRDRNGTPFVYPTGHKHAGKIVYIDKQEEFVSGLKNLLDDIASSKLVRRILFGNSDFDMDTHMKAGGILLVNTAKGELSDLSNVVGKFVLLMSANGIFRRNSSGKDPFHHLLIDEFPDYIYENFPSVPAQSRKYKTIVSVAAQSLAQLSSQYGDDFMYSLMSTFRHKMVYADVDPKTAKVFADFFGEEEGYRADYGESISDSTQSNPSKRNTVTVKKERKLRITPSEIIHLKPFYGAIKLVHENRSMPVRIVKAQFVPEKEYISSSIKADPKKILKWLDYRNKIREKNNFLHPLRDTQILKEGEANPIHTDTTEIKKRMIEFEGVIPDNPLRLVTTEKDLPLIDRKLKDSNPIEIRPEPAPFDPFAQLFEQTQEKESDPTIEKKVSKDIEALSDPLHAKEGEESRDVSQNDLPSLQNVMIRIDDEDEEPKEGNKDLSVAELYDELRNK